jgi:hypothetical protein
MNGTFSMKLAHSAERMPIYRMQRVFSDNSSTQIPAGLFFNHPPNAGPLCRQISASVSGDGKIDTPLSESGNPIASKLTLMRIPRASSGQNKEVRS